VQAAIRDQMTDDVQTLVPDLQSVPVIDVTATAMLTDLDDELTRTGRRLLIAREVGQVRDVLRHAGAEGLARRIHPTVDDAVQASRHQQIPPETNPEDADPTNR